MKKTLLFVATAGLAAATAQPALADSYSFSAQYFTHNATGDFQLYTDSAFTDMVQAALGPTGMPVFNPGYGGGSQHQLTELNSNGEILWWTPDSVNVLNDGTGTIVSPFADSTFYPSQGGGDSDQNGLFQTAIFSGNIELATASTVTFTFGGDDDIFLFVDNLVVGQLGGVHPYTQASPTTGTLSAGTHSFKLFFADRHTVGSELRFSIDTQGLVVTPGVPEPGSWAMMIAGFGALGLAMRRRRTAVSFA